MVLNKLSQACFGSVCLTNPVVPVHIQVGRIRNGEILKESKSCFNERVKEVVKEGDVLYIEN